MFSRDRHVAGLLSRACDRTPMLLPASAFLAGVLASLLIDFSHNVMIWVWMSLTAISTAVLAYYRHGLRLMLIFMSAGAVLGSVEFCSTERISGDLPLQERQGEVLRVYSGDISTVATVRLEDEELTGLTVMTVIGTEIPIMLQPGDRIWFRSELRAATPHHDVEEEIDPLDHLDPHIGAITYISSAEDLGIISTSAGICAYALRLSDKVRRIIDRSQLSSSAKNLLKAVLTGDSRVISHADRDMFGASGIAHMLAVSGMHVGIIAMLASIALWPLVLWRHRRVRILLSVLIVWCYAFFTGLTPSVVRAGVMITLYMLGRMMQRRSSGFNSLCAAVVIVLAFDPWQLLTVSFQLSFAAVAGILLFTDVFNPFAHIRNRLLYALGSAIGVSAAANISAGVIATFYFHTFPVYFIPANLFVGLLMPLFLGAGLLYVILARLGLSAALLCQGIDMVDKLIRGISSFIAGLPGAAVNDIYFPAWTFVPYIAVLIMLKLAYVTRHRDWRRIWLSCASSVMFLSVACVWLGLSRNYPDEWIVAGGEGRSTDIIIRCGDSIRIYTTAGASGREMRIEDIAVRYADYARLRRVNDIRVLTPDDRCSFASCDHMGRLTVGGCNIMVVSRNPKDEAMVRPFDYAVIGSDYRGKMSRLTGILRADTLLLRFTPDSMAVRDLPRIPTIDLTGNGMSFRRRIIK